MKKKVLLITSLLILSGCSLISTPEPIVPVEPQILTVEKLIYITNPLQLPVRPTMPVWTSVDMDCLTNEMKLKILTRDKLRKDYIEQLETIIKSTQTK